MAKEMADYLTEVLAERGEPQDWIEANQVVSEAMLRLGVDRQEKYGHANIAQFAEVGIVVRATDKINRAWNMLRLRQTDAHESIEDSFGDLANYGLYGVMLQRGWWMLPLPDMAQRKGKDQS